MDYLESGNDSHLVVGSEVDKKEKGADIGLVALLTQILLLGYVRDHGGVSQQELEKALLVDANGVVLLLNELEAAGFSIRRRDANDRRRHLVELTSAGQV